MPLNPNTHKTSGDWLEEYIALLCRDLSFIEDFDTDSLNSLSLRFTTITAFLCVPEAIRRVTCQ